MRAQGPYRTAPAPRRRREERDWGGLALCALLLATLAIPIGVALARACFGTMANAAVAAATAVVLALVRGVRAREQGSRDRMLDIVYVALTVGFFAASVALVWLFERL